MKPYKVFLRLEVMQVLGALQSAQRLRISKFIDTLADNPHQSGDYAEMDETARQIEIKVIGQYAITFWADHAVAEVKVTNIGRADRP